MGCYFGWVPEYPSQTMSEELSDLTEEQEDDSEVWGGSALLLNL